MNGILAGLLEKRFHPSQQETPEWFGRLMGWSSTAGIDVTPESALESTAVLACVRVLAESVASLPLKIYERLSDGGKRTAAGHPLYNVLHNAPNPFMTSFEYRETMMGHLLLWGNAISEIEFNKAGQVIGLWPLRPDKVRLEWVEDPVDKDKKRLVYRVNMPNGGEAYLPREKVFHVRGYSHDGYWGMSTIYMARSAIGLSQATEIYGAKFFENGAQPSGVLKTAGHLSEQAYKRLQESWEERHRGLSNAQRIAILEEGLGYEKIGLPPEDAQFLETRKFQISEVARIFRVPPHMIGDLERATFSNIEQQSIDFVTHSLRSWLVRWEQAIYRDLISKSDQSRYFAEFLVDSLLRGETLSRYQAYQSARSSGWITANEIREKENMNPVDGGDELLIPLNMIPASQAGNFGARELTPDGIEQRKAQTPEEYRTAFETRSKQSAAVRRRLMLAVRPAYQDLAARILRREAQDIGKQARKLMGSRGKADFLQWLDDYLAEHEEWIIRQVLGTAQGYAEQIAEAAAEEVELDDYDHERLTRFIRRYVTAYASRHIAESRDRIEAAMNKAGEAGSDVVEALEAEVNAWEDGRARAAAQEETVRTNGAVSEMIYTAAGFALIWRTYGTSCPYCAKLDGVRVGISEYFLKAGEEYQPEGAETPLKPTRNIRHAPAHKGCDCMISAGL